KIARQGRSPHVRGRHGLHPGLLGCPRSRKQLRDEGITYGLALHRHLRRPPTNHIADARSRPPIEYGHHPRPCPEPTGCGSRAGEWASAQTAAAWRAEGLFTTARSWREVLPVAGTKRVEYRASSTARM